MLDDDTLSLAFKALAHPRRARIFRLLAEAPETGHSFGSVQRATGIPDTPLIHHLREMERCGLIRRRRHGNEVALVLTPGPLASAMGEVGRLATWQRAAA